MVEEDDEPVVVVVVVMVEGLESEGSFDRVVEPGVEMVVVAEEVVESNCGEWVVGWDE